MMKYSDSQLRRIERTLGLNFSEIGLLEQALVHDSFVSEFPGVFEESNERLEFLGDSVLDLVVAEELTRRFPERPEGALTQMRSSLVDKAALAELGRKLDLGKWLVMGKGEEEIGGADRDSNLADASRLSQEHCLWTAAMQRRVNSRWASCPTKWTLLRTWKIPRAIRSHCCMRRLWSGAFRHRCTRNWNGPVPTTRPRSWLKPS